MRVVWNCNFVLFSCSLASPLFKSESMAVGPEEAFGLTLYPLVLLGCWVNYAQKGDAFVNNFVRKFGCPCESVYEGILE